MGAVSITNGVVTLPSGRWKVVPEVNRERRGHTFYPDFDALADIPAIYATDGQEFGEKIIHLHYFTGGSDWLITELDPATGEAFGWARVGSYPTGEWGYIDLPALEQLATPARRVPMGGGGVGIVLPVIVERDLHFTPRLFVQVAKDMNLTSVF